MSIEHLGSLRVARSLTSPLSRRTMLGSLAAVAGVIATGKLASAQSTPVASPVAGQWPRTITAVNGKVTIPAKPAKIVATSDWYEVDYVMAIGVRPSLYGYTNRYGLGVSPWLIEAGGEDLEYYTMSDEGPDLELIAAEQPDLIIADPYMAEQIMDPLNTIAPTVAIPTPYSGSSNWREAQVVVGQACGLEMEAAAAIAETEAVAAEGKKTLAPYAGRKVSIAYASEYNGGSLFFSEPGSQEATIVEDLGLTFLPLGPDNTPQSMELIRDLDNADLLISYDFLGGTQVLESNTLFQQLSVVNEGRYALVSGYTARALFAPSTLSVRYAIAGLIEAIITAAEGKGKTLG